MSEPIGSPAGSGAAAEDARSLRADRLRTVGHYLTAVVLALKGYARLEHPEEHRFIIALCFASAAVIVIVTALHSRLHAQAAKVEALVYLLEATVAGTMAVVTVEEGKRGLPFAWAIAAAGLLMGAIMRVRGKPRIHPGDRA